MIDHARILLQPAISDGLRGAVRPGHQPQSFRPGLKQLRAILYGAYEIAALGSLTVSRGFVKTTSKTCLACRRRHRRRSWATNRRWTSGIRKRGRRRRKNSTARRSGCR